MMQNRNMGRLVFLIVTFLLFWMFSCSNEKNNIQVIDLKCEYLSNPLGIGNVNPRLSWKLLDPQNIRGQKQTAFQILVASSLNNLKKGNGDFWDSGKKESDQSVNCTYAGDELMAEQECFWTVRVWDALGNASDWSEAARFTIGLLTPEDWKGEWIYKRDQVKTDHNWYRKTFSLDKKPTPGMVYIGSFGYHELYVNGVKITENVLNPVSSYMPKRIPYLTYDISDNLTKGKNVIAVWHAAGWARWRRLKEYSNPPFVFKAQANIKFSKDELILATDESWKCKKSHSQYYGDWDILDFGGETIDERLREDDWNQADYDDSNWANAIIYQQYEAKTSDQDFRYAIPEDKRVADRKFVQNSSPITAELSPQMVEAQVKYELVSPESVKKNDDGTYVIDMGQNYTGFFEINLHQGTEGDSVLFEISDQREHTSMWAQKSKYIFDKTGEGKFANRFNVAGGRWITVSGLNYLPQLSDIKGYVITNNRKRISKFECSNPLLNKIYEINLKTYIANTLDGILMDCPHRERRGWGEVTVAAMYGDALPNFESGAYMDQYTQYMRDAQSSDGQIRAVINENDRPFLMWKANSPITVWETYRMFGDKKILEDNYASLQKWMNWLLQHSDYETGEGLKIGTQGKNEFPGLGDWCTPKGNFWSSSNSPEAVHFNNCVYAFMLGYAVKIANELDKKEDAKMYGERLKVQQKTIHENFYDPVTGDYGNGQQVNQAFALLTGATPDDEKQKVYNRLVDEVLYEFPYYDTGSSGQALYTRYFTEHGERMDLIYELLQDTRHPSYGYFIRQGVSVWPERWSAVGISQIHTCYTGIGGYFIKGFGGIRNDEDNLGMQDFIVKPSPVGDLTYANTEFQSMYGNIVVNWKRDYNTASYSIEVPVNCSAKIYIPATSKEHVKEGTALGENAEGVAYIGSEKSDAVGNYIIYQVGAGVYHFNVDKLPETDFPTPLYNGNNLSLIGRMSASSMHIETEKLPGFEAFKANDENLETAWKANSSHDEWIEVAWVKPQKFNKVLIKEDGKNISSHKIQYWNDNTWLDIVKGTACGSNKSYTFNAVTASKCRLYIELAANPAVISEFQIIKANRQPLD